MGADFGIILTWWGTMFLVGAVAFPLTKRLFSPRAGGWYDQGYFFAKAVGMAVVTWIVFAFGTIRAMSFSVWSIGVGLGVVFLLGIVFQLKTQNSKLKTIAQNSKQEDGFRLKAGMTILIEELFFFAALLFWSWVKGHEPSIRGLEKFMDFGFMQSILNTRFFPPTDMWYAGYPINYYYFGHMVVAVLTKLSGLDLAYTFNLMLATIFALTLTMSFSIGVQLLRIEGMRGIRAIGGGILTAFLVTLAGNLQTIYAFTRGYTGDNVKPFWELFWTFGPPSSRSAGLWGVKEIWGKIGEGMNTYWYANATRFIPYTIHEFPSYSFVVSDVHGHVLSLPFVLLAIALLIQVFSMKDFVYRKNILCSAFYGFLVGVLLMTNALDGPIYFGLLAVVLGVKSQKSPPKVDQPMAEKVKSWKTWGVSMVVVLFVALLTSLPFLIHFKSFVTGLAVNCPPGFLANSKIGPIIFEGVEKCQISPLWMWVLLWGFFVYCGTWLICTNRTQKLLITFFLFALALVIFPEFFYFKDIYPMHFRSNTMFKLGYEAFILFSIVSGYTIVTSFKSKVLRMLFLLFLLPLLFLVSIYPIFSVRSYFDSLKTYKGLNGMVWLKEQYPDDYAGILWLNKQEEAGRAIVEADGDSYTDYARVSAFTGIPTIIGWPVHEWLWRGTYDVVAPRREEVRTIYESQDIDEMRKILAAYGVRYIVVGKLEREKYKELQEWKFAQPHGAGAGFSELSQEVFRSGGTIIYETY